MSIVSIIIALIVFGVIIFIHELGHFLLAKKSGIFVEEFSIGMGPTLFHFTKKETKYSIKLLPLGGSCAMLGEDDASDDKRAFGNQSVWARMAVVVAGPFFNFILAFLLAIFVVSVAGINPPMISGYSMDNSPAKEAGMLVGDQIKKMDGSRIDNFNEISLFLQVNQSLKPITVEFLRDGKKMNTTITPVQDESGYYLIGIASKRVKGSIPQIIKYSAIEVKYVIKSTVQSLGMMIRGRVHADQMAGPVRLIGMIGDTYTQSAKVGILTVLLNLANLTILISANLGVMNLLPIPALDGGRLFFLIIEAIRRKKIPAEKEGYVHFIGFCLLMCFMAFVFFNDIRNIFF